MQMDVCVIGAGPAGMSAAVAAGRSGASVVIVEGNPRPGKKLLATGGGRCNLTHTGDVEEFLRVYGPYGRWLRHALYTAGPEAVRGFFEEQGLVLKVEKNGCVFPVTDRAEDVVRVLINAVRDARGHFEANRAVTAVRAKEAGFEVVTAKETYAARAVVIATGGASWPHTGSRGDGYRFATELGHRVSEARPALTGIVLRERALRMLTGVSVEPVEIWRGTDRRQATRGGLVFTEWGISGPAVLDMSRLLADAAAAGSAEDVVIDFLPDTEEAALEETITRLCGQNPRKEVAGVITGLLPRSLCIQICEPLGEGRPVLGAHLSREMRRALVASLKRTRLAAAGLRGLGEATITRGGVSLEEVDDKTMGSTLRRGLYFAGEVLDADGPCGGYNLQIAWSTGTLAGMSAAEYVRGAGAGA